MSSQSEMSAPRKGQRSRSAILRAAADLATIEGLNGLSIGGLATHMGMSKSGLYAHFSSKEALQLATVDTAKAIFDADVVTPTEDIDDPLEHVRAIADAFLAHVERRVFPGGCFFISVSAEFDMQPGAVKDRLLAFQAEWGERLIGLIATARERGRVRPEEDPSQLAFELTSFMLMGDTAFVMNDDPGFLDHARVAIDMRLRQAAGERSGAGGGG
jgi:AcrR family transcriptional regulator